MKTLASAAAAFDAGGFILVDDTNTPGLYRFDVPDAAFAAGVEWVIIAVKVAGSLVYYERFNLATATTTDVKTDTAAIKLKKIVGSADMTPALIAKEAKDAGLTNVANMPTVDVAGKAINSGTRARAFASYMRIHALEASGGFTYAQMGRFTAKPDAPKAELAVGGGTDNPQYALVDAASKQPVANGARNLWVTETALTTALNTSYMADRLGLFGIVVGVALLLSGIGFIILAFAALHRPKTAASLS
jgi:hypothetical protein